jgi:hypothetical protein
MRILRPHLLALFLALAIALGAVQPGAAATARAVVPETYFVKRIKHYRSTTLKLQRVMGHRVRFRRLAGASIEHAHKVWRKRAVVAQKRFLRGPAHKSAWLCIHRYEGAWSDGGSPYYGGLQMDISFQASYGGILLASKGTADNWTPLEQMWVAERAFRSGRGFYPWPNTARYCGLI